MNSQDILQALQDTPQALALVAAKMEKSPSAISDFISKMTDNETTIYIDGGSRGNPGISGAGVVVETPGKKKGYYYFLGEMTNNAAEYSALLRALKYCMEEKINKVKIFTDSELLARQMNGQYAVKSKVILPFYRDAVSLINKIGQVKINSIPRTGNKDADRMANMAMDLKKDGVVELMVAG